jgi:hypothetical protein
MNPLPHALHATIQEKEEGAILLQLADGQTLRWPQAYVSPEAQKGDIVHVCVFPEAETDEERRRIAKEVLNEVLKGDES